jgi:hypothetical protein
MSTETLQFDEKTQHLGPMLGFLKYFRRKNWAKNLAFLVKNISIFCKICITTLVFKKNANFFLQKLPKIAENCDRNIDP